MSDLATMNSNFFQIELKNKKTLIIVGVVSAVLSVVFSSPTFIKPKFKSQAIVYPSNLGGYSEESPIEQMMQWFESRTIKESLIKEFNLAEHYDIDPENKLADYYLLLEYDENVKIDETKYESAEIVVTDTDPEQAYKMVNSIIDNVNKVIRAEHKKRAFEEFKTIEIEFNNVKKELDSVANELKTMRTDYNIINYSSQSDHIVRGFLKTFDGANSTSVNTSEILKLKKNIEEKGGDFIEFEKRFYYLIDSYNFWDNEYKKANRNVTRVMTYTNLVSEPAISNKKVYPVRWLIVALATFGAVFFAFVIILFQQKIKK